MRRDALRQMISLDRSSYAFQNALAKAQRDALALSDRLSGMLEAGPGGGSTNPAIDVAFNNLGGPNNNSLSRQLYQVAKCVSANGRSFIQGTRQVFYVTQEGYDSHGGQASAQESLFKILDAAIGSFYAALVAMGMQNDVTTFTASDFGRTFKPNNSGGTDHAWGNEHFVIGGSVKGHREFGTYPVLQLGGPSDAESLSSGANGRWIPTISVSQYGATLAKWLKPDVNVREIFPELSRFNSSDIGFMKDA